MNNKIIKTVVLCIIMCLSTITLGTTACKYTKDIPCFMTVESNQYFEVITSTDNYNVISPEFTGYYAVITKGGNGGCGVKGESNSWTVRENTEGIGGTIINIVQINSGDFLIADIGTRGGDASKEKKGTAGTNVSNIGRGSSGTNAGDDFNMLYKKACSGGSGAATVLFKVANEKTADVFDYSELTHNYICSIAAGGGASAAIDDGYATNGTPGNGGNGGSNIEETDSASVNYPSSGLIYNGYDGTQPSGNDSYGLGATAIGGNGGNGGTAWTGANFNGFIGSNYANAEASGLGGSSAGLGGPGGGGYAGGGGGGGMFMHIPLSGINFKVNPGGGGGGSSYIANIANPYSDELNLSASKMKNIYDDMLSMASVTSIKDMNDGNGFAIILYLGKDLNTLK